jgi:catechol 2,3-dioxygenase-like lactoylglutathione lyase family enzyme
MLGLRRPRWRTGNAAPAAGQTLHLADRTMMRMIAILSLERRISMTEPIRFDGISLPVSDVDRTVSFYQQFGFELLIRHDNFALLRLGEGTIGLLKMDLSKWPGAPRGAIHIELSTENLDALYEQLQARGVHFDSPPVDRSWERQMFTHDPDGYRLEIAQGRRG